MALPFSLLASQATGNKALLAPLLFGRLYDLYPTIDDLASWSRWMALFWNLRVMSNLTLPPAPAGIDNVFTTFKK